MRAPQHTLRFERRPQHPPLQPDRFVCERLRSSSERSVHTTRVYTTCLLTNAYITHKQRAHHLLVHERVHHSQAACISLARSRMRISLTHAAYTPLAHSLCAHNNNTRGEGEHIHHSLIREQHTHHTLALARSRKFSRARARYARAYTHTDVSLDTFL
jgi:hypothetical protein